MMSPLYRKSGTFDTFDGDFNLADRRFLFNRQIEVTANTIFRRTLWEYVMVIPGQPAKLNVHQFVSVANLLNLMSAECTISMVHLHNVMH